MTKIRPGGDVKLLVFGAGGQLGRALIERAGDAAIGVDRMACDICDAEAVDRALATDGLSAVVNCAAYTAVDRAEHEKERAFAVNALGAGNVAYAAAKYALPVIHLSTDYVYDGTRVEPYREDCPVNPINVYGASKAAGDAAVMAANPSHLLLRVSWVFGAYGLNFVKSMLRLGRERSELRIVDDQKGGPTEARDIADAILAIAAACRQPHFAGWGAYHFAGAPTTTWYGFAQAIFAQTREPAPKLVPIASQDYPTAAKRPSNSVLDCGKIHDRFAIPQPDWRIALKRVVTQLEKETP
jgi:dTDP-4-dehydrorhamnose reductase